MGIVFGVTGTKGPVYDVLCKTNCYEIRHYAQNHPFLTAEVGTSPGGSGNEGFRVLAKYIGVFGQPANEESRPMAMTHPVIMDSKGPKEVMKFVLPEEFTHVDKAPKPTDPNIVVKENPAQYIAVVGFSGWYNPELGLQQLSKLSSALYKDQFIQTEDRQSLDWSIAQYHPPFTIPFLRLNEVWIRLDPEQSAALKELLHKSKSIDNK